MNAFEMAASRERNRQLKDALLDISQRIKRGEDPADALQAKAPLFPPLMIDMFRVAERSGTAPEVLANLADHYESSQRLRGEFISQITMPIVQLVAAVFIIAGLLYVLGLIGESKGTGPIDVLGWGLVGADGAARWLTGWGLAAAIALGGYLLLRSFSGGQRAIDGLLFKLPVIGHTLQAFGVARFSWALYVTQEAAVPIVESLKSSLAATSNGAFIAKGDQMGEAVSSGATLVDAFTQSKLFPDDFLQIVAVSESAGTVPEALNRLSPQFEDRARRSLRMLAGFLASIIWLAVAAFIIVVIFRVAQWYMGQLQGALDEMEG